MKIKLSIITFLLLLVVTSTFSASNKTDNLQQWKHDRMTGLKKPHGWLSLIGLEWLKVGDNSIGSAEGSDIKLPHGPDRIGVFHLDKQNSISFSPTEGSKVSVNEFQVTEKTAIYADSSDQELSLFSIDSFQFYVIERGKFGLRIKDSKAKTRTEFQGLKYFPVKPKLDIVAKFIPYEPAKKIEIINVLGLLSVEESPGKLVFSIAGNEYSLDALDSTNSYFMIFADKTNGRTTYGSGRFIYTDGKVDENGMVRIDFNKAYNPPCAFTEFSTCSLPPPQNRLNLFIEAGEKKYGDSKY